MLSYKPGCDSEAAFSVPDLAIGDKSRCKLDREASDADRLRIVYHRK
jgi:hypothetical protein